MNNETKRTVSINQTFDAPIILVWEAWSQPEHIAKWWGTKGMEIDVIRHEFRAGGQ